MSGTNSFFLMLIPIGAVTAVFIGWALLYLIFRIKVGPGSVLIINRDSRNPRVVFTDALVLPFLHQAEIMEMPILCLEVDLRGKEAARCHDLLKADITVAFYLRVNRRASDILAVADTVGVNQASDGPTIDNLFHERFTGCVRKACGEFDLTSLFEERLIFRDRLRELIGDNLNGYVLEDAAIDYLAQTPVAHLDPSDSQDALAIEKIERAARLHQTRLEAQIAEDNKKVEAKAHEAAAHMSGLLEEQALAEELLRRELSLVGHEEKKR